MSKTIFDKIIAGEIPCHKVYEDEQVLAFLDIAPNRPGHTLLIPKEPVEFIWQMTDEDYSYLMLIAKRIGNHLQAKLRTKYVGIQVIGEQVPHAHIHLIPFDSVDQFFNHNAPEASQIELETMAKKLSTDKLLD